MSVVSPAAMLLLWLLLVVAALHRRRRARRQITLPSLHMLPETTLTGAAAGGDPTDRLLLLIRLLVALAMIFALAGPSIQGAGVARMVVVIDASASMAAPDPADPERSRMQTAKARALAAIEQADPGRVLILAAGAAPRVVGRWTAPADVEDSLTQLAAEEGGGDLALALAEARQLAGPEGVVRLFSDGGAPIPGNLAIASLTFRPYLNVVERGAFLVTVRRGPLADGEEADDVFVRIDAGGERVATVRVTVPAQGEGSAAVEYRGPGGGPARASLLGDDPLAADDHAVTPVPRLTRRQIALVTPGNPELLRALRAWPRGAVDVRPPGRHPAADLLVLDGEVEVGADRAAVLLRPPGETRRVTARSAPRRRPGLAAGVARGVVEASPLPPAPPGARVLLAAVDESPLLWINSAPEGARAALAFDPGKSGLGDDPMHAAFWADLLEELLLPDDGGCVRAPVGYDTAGSGLLTRVGLYELPEGCFVAGVPDSESRPVEPTTASLHEAPDPGGRRDLAGILSALGLLLLLVEWALARRTRVGSDRRRGPRLLRLAALIGLALAIAPPWGPMPDDPGAAYVIDGSPSVPADAREHALERVKGWAADEEFQTVFGADGRSDLGGALALAGRRTAPGGSVIALTDGRTTVGEAPVQVAAALRRRGLTVHVGGVWEQQGDAWIDEVAAPARVRSGATVVVTAVVRRVGPPVAGTVRFRLDGEQVSEEAVDLTDASVATVATRVRLAQPGRRELRAELLGFAPDASNRNDAGGALIDVSGGARTLWVGVAAAEGLTSEQGLMQAGLGDHQISRILPGALPPDAAQLGRYDLVILDDVGISSLPRGASDALSRYARAGGGLLVGGGAASFGPGGYPGTSLDSVLPLKSDPRKAGGRLAAVLLLDKSGSMGGDEGGWERLLLAKATMRSLLASFRRPDDRVGVLGYDTGPVVVMPMTDVAEVQADFIDTGSLHPAGGTDPVPALHQAKKMLGPADRFPTRHVIVVSDGRFPGTGAEAAIRELRDAGITTSTVGVGTASDERRLRAIASAGGGDHAGVTELSDLPGVIARHLLSAVQDPVHLGEVAVRSGPDLLGILPEAPSDWPPLAGMVRTALRNDAHLWLVAESGEPLLAGRRAGAGRTAAFAAHLAGPWSARWSAQEQDATLALFASAVAWTTRRDRGGWEAEVEELDGASVRVSLDAIDGAGRPVSDLHLVAAVQAPGGGQVHATLIPAAPGRYVAEVPAPGTGVVAAEVMSRNDVVARAAMLRLAHPELRARGDDAGALAAIAEAGGGLVIGAETQVAPGPSSSGGPAPTTPRPRGWPLLAALGAFMLYLRQEGRPG